MLLKGPNKYDILPGGLVRLYLTQGQSALIDLADLPVALRYRWHAHHVSYVWYAKSWMSQARGRKRSGISLHRLLLQAPKGLEVDHRNGDGLDNRRQNLRLTDHAGNMQNFRRVPGRSGRRGVYWHHSGRWKAQIRVDNRVHHLGIFDTIEEAATAYRAACEKLHGEFSVYRGVLAAVNGKPSPE